MNVYIWTSGELKNAYIGEVWTPWINTIAYYPLEKDANDYSWNNRHWTNSWVTFSNGLATFNGSASITLWTADRTKIQTYPKATISVWFNRNWNKNWWMIIWKMQTNPTATSNAVYCVYVRYDSNAPLYPNQICWWIYTWDGWTPEPLSFQWAWQLATANTRYNVVITKDWTTKKWYINWVKIVEKSTTNTATTYNPDLIIWWWTYYNNDVRFTWNISNVIFEDITWTDQNVQDYYNSTKSLYWIS